MEPERTRKLNSLEQLLYPQGLATTESYELTEEEKEQAIRQAQIEKEKRLKHAEDMERRRLWEKELLRPWKPSEMMTFVRWKAAQRGIDFRIDADNHSVYKALAMYFTRDEKFAGAGRGFSLNKGIMLCGNCGTGKTTLMELFQANQYQSFSVVRCIDVADSFKKDGEHILQAFSKPIPVPPHATNFYQSTMGTCFDDLGTEGIKGHYGDKVNVMADIILNRYDKKIPYHFTHLMTNLTTDEIEQYYGARVRSRMREMFNQIILTGEDRRK